MRKRWGQVAFAGSAMAAITLALTPAMGAAGDLMRMREQNPVSLGALGSISSFTPTTSNPRLAAAYAKAALNGSGKSFRFTPTSGSMSGRRSITVLVRADDDQPIRTERTLPTLSITPVAFNLDVSRGWRKFALPDSVGRKELDPVPVETFAGAKGFALEQQKKTRFSTNVLVDAKRDTGTAPQTLAGESSYSVDLASSYSLTRNVNVTAGVRYRGPINRLTPITDDRQDSQALYLGTVFKF